MARPKKVKVDRRRPAGCPWTISLGGVARRVRAGLALLLRCVIVAAVMIAIAGALIYGYMRVGESSYFMVRPDSILVTGLSRLSRAEALKAAGLDAPVNNLTLDTAKAKEGLKALPWVAEAEIGQTWPDGLSLDVTEHSPRAIVSLDGLYYIDRHGLPFKRLDPGELSDLPIITGLTVDDLTGGGPLVRDALDEIFGLIGRLEARDDEFKASEIAEYHYDPDRGLTLFTRGTRLEIKVGLGGHQKKFWRLGRVMAHLRREQLTEGLAYVNLEYPMRVTVSYRGQPPLARGEERAGGGRRPDPNTVI
jgi:cell division protein FtsQ